MKGSLVKEVIKNIFEVTVNESTNSFDRGSYVGPLVPGTKLFDKSQLAPFTNQVSSFDDAELAVDSYDGKLDVSKQTANKLEKKARKISRFLKRHPELTMSDEDGNSINGYDTKKIFEVDSSTTAGPYNGPISIGEKEWDIQTLSPFIKGSKHEHNTKNKKKRIKGGVKGYVGHYENDHPQKNKNNHLITPEEKTLKEDLGVWFGTKKKPKGSKQPKGPWVNICRKKEGGGHPPCGRPEADSKGYPKCRAAGVASKMTDAQKKSACSQKRRAEKKKPKTGTGNKPTMVSYKPKKKKSQNESIIKQLILKSLRSK